MKITLTIIVVLMALIVIAGIWLYTPDKSQAALEARYATADDHFIPVAGLRLRVRDTGPKDAPAVILLHGFGSSLETWEGWAKPLSHSYRVIRFDLPGFGLSGPDPAGDYSDARTVVVLGALMDALAVKRADLVGNSLGGKIAWLFAADHPARVDKLVLVSPDGFASPGFEYGKPAKVPAVAGILPYVLPTGLVRMSLRPAYADDAALTPAVVTRYRDMMLAPGIRGAIVARMQQVMLRPPEPVLSRIQAPTLLLWGEEDGMIPFANAADYMKWIPNCRIAALPKLGHVPMEEAPERSLAPVQAFLASSPG
jgi:pimeloyl-ACP methyl ester carboxylesterase